MKTKIEWTKNADGTQGESWNPLRCREINGNINRSKSGHFGTGCTMVSPGCANCYAGSMNYRFYGNGYGYHSKPTEFFLDDKIINRPGRVRKPTTFFVGSMTDIFHENVPDSLIWSIFSVMQSCWLNALAVGHGHLFQLLTKRPERMRDFVNEFVASDFGGKAPGKLGIFGDRRYCWLGTTAENQEQADIRIPILMNIPAAIHWVSVEPMLGPVDLRFPGALNPKRPDYLEKLNREQQDAVIQRVARSAYMALCETPDWIVCGGESGSNARPMNPHWALSLRDQCVAAGVSFFFKQWGAFRPAEVGDDPDKVTAKHYRDGGPKSHTGLEEKLVSEYSGVRMINVGKKAAGRLLDGREWNEMPEVKR